MGTGHYARSYWRKVEQLVRDAETSAAEMETTDRSEDARALRSALENVRRASDFTAAALGLNRIRNACYSALGTNGTSTRSPKRRNPPFLPTELRQTVPTLLTSTFDQVQGCYAFEFWDAALVMIRKFVETSIILGFELSRRGNEIKVTGQYLSFGDLVGKAKSGSPFRLARDSKTALDAVKRLGDNAAHNPRFVGRRSDLEGIRGGLRILTEDLIKNLKDFEREEAPGLERH